MTIAVTHTRTHKVNGEERREKNVFHRFGYRPRKRISTRAPNGLIHINMIILWRFLSSHSQLLLLLQSTVFYLRLHCIIIIRNVWVWATAVDSQNIFGSNNNSHALSVNPFERSFFSHFINMQSVASHHHLLIRHRFRRHIQIEYEMMRLKRNERRKNEEDENNRFLFGSRSRGYVVNVCECVSFCWYKDALRSVANQHVSVCDEWIDAKSDGMEPNNRYGLHAQTTTNIKSFDWCWCWLEYDPLLYSLSERHVSLESISKSKWKTKKSILFVIQIRLGFGATTKSEEDEPQFWCLVRVSLSMSACVPISNSWRWPLSIRSHKLLSFWCRSMSPLSVHTSACAHTNEIE